MKKLFLAVILLCLILSCSCAGAAESYTCGAFTYTLLEDGTAEITDYAEEEDVWDVELVIPSDLDGHRVTSIGNNAFENAWSLRSVVVPEGVTHIGSIAFDECSNMTSITLPEGIVSIGSKAFMYCDDLTEMVLPESVVTLGDFAFSNCTSLTSINIPYSLMENGTNPFPRCENLTEYRIVADHPAYMVMDGMLINLNTMEVVSCLPSAPEALVIPEGITSIAWSAFSNHSNLTSVTLPSSMTYISDGAFGGSKMLNAVTIPEGVTGIGFSAFSECSQLTSVVLPQSLETMDWYAFSETGLTEMVIPEGVTLIDKYAFLKCKKLEKVTIEASKVDMKESIFNACDNLSAVTVKEGSTAEAWCKANGINCVY